MAQTFPFSVPSGSNITPDVSGTANLGSTSLYFSNVYANNVSAVSLTVPAVNVTGATVSGNAIYQGGQQIIDTIASTGAGTSLYATKVGSTAYLNSVTGVGTVTISGPTNGVVTVSGAKGGYTIDVQTLTSSPADAATAYFGTLPKAPTTTAAQSKVYIRKSGTIIGAEIYSFAGTAGTAEAWSHYIRKNNTTDFLIATISAATSERVWTNWNLNGGSGIAMASGDYFEIKMINPTWVTNPLTYIAGGYVYIQE
jgi:hypothetical protein